jgi:hypothetical protein
MVVHDVICNGCGCECVGFPPVQVKKKGQERDKIHTIRYLYKMCGWRVGLPGGEDYCPDCWEKRKKR